MTPQDDLLPPCNDAKTDPLSDLIREIEAGCDELANAMRAVQQLGEIAGAADSPAGQSGASEQARRLERIMDSAMTARIAAAEAATTQLAALAERFAEQTPGHRKPGLKKKHRRMA
ncbi:hypothetical protein PPN31114_01896 [Pandoraea pneumonica]|jgi:hypothetical protein|uniref:Chemotaxis protein n=1 Tax=Pandoraea pneumonica TaxID=2508299 RepID=A0A5E4UAU6_9BURK|nr:hypothetical protein [Pandoraea pneumonica]VVD96632.1 hypothetical protein PPN31114_01896 [Pandoraea pneumonica]